MKTTKILEMRLKIAILLENKNKEIPAYFRGMIDALYMSNRISEASFHRIDKLLTAIIRDEIVSFKGYKVMEV